MASDYLIHCQAILVVYTVALYVGLGHNGLHSLFWML